MFLRRKIILMMVVALMMVSASTIVQAQDDGLTESPDGPEAVKVYYTLEDALAKVFDKPDTTWSEVWDPSGAEISTLEGELGWKVPPGPVEFHRARDGDKDLGWAVVTEEKGRFKPITFMVQIAPDGRVQMVLVMVYRESRGEGVKRQRFLKQFRKKDTGDHLRLNRDIVGVSGATLSSRAITAGVKRVLAQVQMHYQKSQEGP